jgi:hypothetical protein
MIQRWREIESWVNETTLGEDYHRIRWVADWNDQNLQQQRDEETRRRALERIGTIKIGTQAEEIHNVIRQISDSGAEVPAELHQT